MAVVNTDSEENPPLNEAAVEPDLYTIAVCENVNKLEPNVTIEHFTSFSTLGKAELMQYAEDPFWKKVRSILFNVFWTGWFSMLVAAIVIIIMAPRCPTKAHRPDHKWYTQAVVYEILPESFQDSIPKSKGMAMEGDGIGDINGITSRLSYLKSNVGSNVLYINSIYKRDDDDGMVVVNHKSVESVLGTIEDFDQLRKTTKKMKIRLIMDFIPNHTSTKSEWFKKSQEKVGKYTGYYVWASCDRNSDVYPNNWMSQKGGRAWTYDNIRKECYLHQLERNKPDLNLWNADVRQELEGILHFWLDKGVDGFHVLNAESLYEDQNLGDEILISEKAGNAYDDFEHNQTINHPENMKLLSAWKSVLDSYNTMPGREKALVVSAKDDLNTTMAYFEAGATIVRANLLNDCDISLAECIETKLKDFNAKGFGWMYSDRDSSRLASKVNPEQVKAFMTLQATLPGVSFNYYGNEIGMTDHPSLPVPLKYRTPMQWNREGTGFSKNISWLAQNPNYENVSVETEKAVGDDYTTLKVFRRLSKLRENESFKWGHMNLFRDRDVLMLTRKADGFPGYLVAINLGSNRVNESFHWVTKIPKNFTMVFHTHKDDNTAINMSGSAFDLEANHAVVLEYN